MSEISDAVDALTRTDPLPAVASRRRSAPKGWEPGIVWNGESGSIITDPIPTETLVTHQALLENAGFDVTEYEIVGDLQWREWDAAVGGGEVRRFRYWRANIRRRRHDAVDVADLVKRIRKRVPHKRTSTGDGTLVVPLADWQIGKRDGDGVAGTVDRLIAMLASVTDEIRRLKPERLVVAGMGDLVEGCWGFYPNQEFTTQLNRRDQEKVVREMLTQMLTTWARHVGSMVVVAVGGNHGENRRNGPTSATDQADNADVAVFEQVAAVLAANPDAYGHVSFVIPSGELAVVLEIEGWNIAFTHGHLFGKGPTARRRGESWWKGQMFGRQPAGDAEILVSAHFHTFSVSQQGPRTHIACPTLDGGSDWFVSRLGVPSAPGQLTFFVSSSGWDHIRIH